MQKHENQIKMYIIKTCGAIYEDFENYHFLKASFHHDYTKLYRNDYFFPKLELQTFHLI
jgi:hypothetical protein